jgi:hypothetical protein
MPLHTPYYGMTADAPVRHWHAVSGWATDDAEGKGREQKGPGPPSPQPLAPPGLEQQTAPKKNCPRLFAVGSALLGSQEQKVLPSLSTAMTSQSPQTRSS